MTARDRLLLSGLVVLAVLAGAWFGLLAPVRSESASLDTQVAAARSDRDTAVQQASAIAAAERDRASDVAALAALGKAVPADDQTASLLYELAAASGRSRVQLQSITPTPPTAAAAAAVTTGATGAPAGVTPSTLTLEFRGRYADLQRFLARVQNHATVRGDAVRVRGRLIDVTGVKLTADPTKGGRVEASIEATVYTATPAAAAAGSSASSTTAPSGEASAAAPPPTQPAAIGVGG